MKYYILDTTNDDFDSVLFKDTKSWDLSKDFNGTPLSNKWIPQEVTFFKSKIRVDFFYLAGHIPVSNKTAHDHILPLIKNNCEVLLLKEKKESLFAYNVFSIGDFLDKKKSKVEYFDDGGIMFIEEYNLKNKINKDHHIFKIENAELQDVFVSEKFKEVVEQNDLKGINFKKVK